MLADAYGIAVAAIEQCGAENRECINDKIRNVEDYDGISGKFSLKNGENTPKIGIEIGYFFP